MAESRARQLRTVLERGRMLGFDQVLDKTEGPRQGGRYFFFLFMGGSGTVMRRAAMHVDVDGL